MDKKVTVKVYILRTENGNWLGQVVLTSNGSFMSITDYGNFAYSWSGFGDDIRKFILSLNVDYFAQKMFNGISYIASTNKVCKSAVLFAEKILPALKEAIRKELESEKSE